MSIDRGEASGGRATRSPARWIGGAVVVPLGLVISLRVLPDLDLFWKHTPSHFWLVLSAAAIATTLASAVFAEARRRHDARLLMVSLAFITCAAFLGLHALATPGILLGPNPGFELATPVGLVLGSGFAVASVVEFAPGTNQGIMARTTPILAVVVAVAALWLVVSLLEFPPLDAALARESLQGWQITFAVVGVVGYAVTALGFARLYRSRGAPILLAASVAFALLAAALVVVAVAINWQVSWWEWHVLMLVAFGLISLASRREWHEERFSALYLERTLDGTADVSILFADLQSFTPYSEATSPTEVRAMLKTYFSALIPLMRDLGGDVHQLIGDAMMVVFNKHGTQPDHPFLAARAALAYQRTAEAIAAGNPDWPRFRVGVNTGEVATGVTGERGYRRDDVIGDTVNLAARLESLAPVGGVLVGAATREHLPDDAVIEELPAMDVKGKSDPVTAYVLHGLAR